MDAKELRAKTPAELADELLKLRKEQFSLRMQRATGQSPKPDQFGKVRRNIARLKTVQRQALTAAAVKGEAAVAVVAAQAAAKPAAAAKKAATRVRSAKKTATGGKQS